VAAVTAHPRRSPAGEQRQPRSVRKRGQQGDSARQASLDIDKVRRLAELAFRVTAQRSERVSGP
jgi:hypothetical protein